MKSEKVGLDPGPPAYRLPGQAQPHGVRGDERRRLLKLIASLGAAGASGYLCDVLAAGDAPPGLHRLDGTGTINGRPAKAGSPIAMGDKIATGPKSQAVVVLKGDAFLMRSDTVIEVSGSSGVLSTLTIATGAVMSVFAKRNLAVKAASATIGIRGTGAYFEVDNAGVYFCLCYGEAVISGPNMPDKAVKTTHHESPLMITGDKAAMRTDPGGFKNHTDAELTMLESLVGREPPFVKDAMQYPRKQY